MNFGDVVIWVLLTIGCLLTLLWCAAMLIVRTGYDRLHYLSPVVYVAAPVITAAVIVAEGWSSASLKAALIWLLLALVNPAVTYAGGKALFLRHTREEESS